MDPRIREHAEVIVDHALELESGEDLVISLPPSARELGVALHEAAGDRGANPVYLNNDRRAERAFLRASDPDAFDTPDHELALYEAADATVIVRGGPNATERSDVAPETTAAHKRARRPVKEERLATRWCLTAFPTAGDAQRAGMSTDAYENFVWDAVSLDWDAQRAFQAEMVDILDDATEVRIVAGDTDLRLSVAGNSTLNDDGRANLPGGEVFTAPVVDSVEGEVHFDLPLARQGRLVEGIRMRFENGRVVSYAADRNERVLDGVLDTDEGANYLGELGIGMNRRIDRFTRKTLFDEKMGDTVHLALGSAYPATVGDDNELNESAEHVDMLVDTSEDARIEVDGEVVQRNGEFAFEA